MARKKKITPTIEERAVEASLNGSNALSVFEQAASDLDHTAAVLQDLGAEANTAADTLVATAQAEAERILAEARARAEELSLLGLTLDDEAAGHVRRASKIRELVGMKPSTDKRSSMLAEIVRQDKPLLERISAV